HVCADPPESAIPLPVEPFHDHDGALPVFLLLRRAFAALQPGGEFLLRVCGAHLPTCAPHRGGSVHALAWSLPNFFEDVPVPAHRTVIWRQRLKAQEQVPSPRGRSRERPEVLPRPALLPYQ